MVDILDKTMFHNAMILFNGKTIEIEKVKEEINELLTELAMDHMGKGDRDKIIEELADVEIVLPYLKSIYIPQVTLKIESQGIQFGYEVTSQILLYLISLRQKSGPLRILDQMLVDATTLLCYSLGDIYKKYQIKPEEVQSWKEEKYRRCLKQIGKKILGR